MFVAIECYAPGACSPSFGCHSTAVFDYCQNCGHFGMCEEKIYNIYIYYCIYRELHIYSGDKNRRNKLTAIHRNVAHSVNCRRYFLDRMILENLSRRARLLLVCGEVSVAVLRVLPLQLPIKPDFFSASYFVLLIRSCGGKV